MNENKLRAEVVKRRKQLKRSEDGEVPERTWSFIEEMGWLQDATEKFDEEAVDYIVGWLDTLDEVAPGSYRGRTSSDDSGGKHSEDGDRKETYFEVKLGDYEKERQKAFAEIMARYVAHNEDAKGDKEIANFRRDFFGGSLLSSEQAYALLESPAARYFHASWFEELGIPVVGHTSEVVGQYDPGIHREIVDHRVTVRVEPPGITRTVRYTHPDTPALGKGQEDLRACFIYKDNDSVVEPYERLPYRDREGFKETAYLWPGSLLDHIRLFNAKWAKLYGWKEEDMLWVLLTGEAPRLNALKVNVRHSVGNQATITLTAAPWISADVVKKNFQNVQQQVLIKDNQALPLRSIRVLRFVERIVRRRGEFPTWPELLAQWNRENPQWAYKSYRGLRQTYHRTLTKVVHSPFRLPEPKPSPKAEKRAREVRDRFLNAL